MPTVSLIDGVVPREPRKLSGASRRSIPSCGEKENRDTGKSWPPELKPPGSGALA